MGCLREVQTAKAALLTSPGLAAVSATVRGTVAEVLATGRGTVAVAVTVRGTVAVAEEAGRALGRAGKGTLQSRKSGKDQFGRDSSKDN